MLAHASEAFAGVLGKIVEDGALVGDHGIHHDSWVKRAFRA
jgi:hypothetical protein